MHANGVTYALLWNFVAELKLAGKHGVMTRVSIGGSTILSNTTGWTVLDLALV